MTPNVPRMVDTLTQQIAEADMELRKLAKSDATCARLMSVPGVGPVTAVRFVAALDSVERFPSAHKVEVHLGLTTRENSSSDSQRPTSIHQGGRAGGAMGPGTSRVGRAQSQGQPPPWS
jgi:transposase